MITRFFADTKLRKWVKALSLFALIPGAVLLGLAVPGEKRYAYVTLAVAALTLLVFIAGLETPKVKTRRLVVAAVFIALSVAGRFIPLFKPVTALTIISAVSFGGETGFFVGSLSAAVSNFYFGQGPWTPFQMLAWGLIGFLAGLLAKPLKKSPALLLGYGLLAGAAYSFIMDIWMVLWYNGRLDGSLYWGALIAALPHTALYAVSNVLFLALFSKPFFRKLQRMKNKYDI